MYGGARSVGARHSASRAALRRWRPAWSASNRLGNRPKQYDGVADHLDPGRTEPLGHGPRKILTGCALGSGGSDFDQTVRAQRPIDFLKDGFA